MSFIPTSSNLERVAGGAFKLYSSFPPRIKLLFYNKKPDHIKDLFLNQLLPHMRYNANGGSYTSGTLDAIAKMSESFKKNRGKCLAKTP